MERMEGVDAGYLYLETPTMHMHTVKVALLEPAEAFDPAHFADVVLDRLGDLPAFRRRPLPAPFGLDHPLWAEDREIDPDRHIVLHGVPEPGGMRGVEALVGRVASTPLARDKPLWELHVSDPLDDGRIVVVAKMHHALADGGAANALLARVTDAARDAEGPAPRREPDAVPSRSVQLRLAVVDTLTKLLGLPGLLLRTARGVLGVLRLRRGHGAPVPRPILDAPRSSLNGPLTARRSFATATLALDEVRSVARTNEVTVNDVVLAVVAGSLRRWLDDRGERPSGSLLAGVPVGTDTGAEPRLAGNRVSNLFTTLATDVEDPRERLRTIAATTRQSKRVQQTLGADLLREWVEFTPPLPMSWAMRAYSRVRGAGWHNPPFNVVVSNVRGPGEEVSIAGARLVDLFSVGPILEGIGLNVTAWSYAGRLNFSLLSCPDLVPDLRPIADGLERALADLSS